MTTKTSMSIPGAEIAGLQRLAEQFKTWRATRRRGQHIPEDLWQAATDFARVHGLNPTVAALRLNYYALQRRLQTGRAPGCERANAPVFVELPAVPTPAGGDERGTIELVQAGGVRLILRLPAVSPRDLLPVMQLFLRHRL